MPHKTVHALIAYLLACGWLYPLLHEKPAVSTQHQVCWKGACNKLVEQYTTTQT